VQNLHISKTSTTPEINLSPAENNFYIGGNSAPEDVRALYYPVTEWISLFIDDLLEGEYKNYNKENPVIFRIDFSYFNSSSAKFLYDIIIELKRLPTETIPVVIEWHYEEGDHDMYDAGVDISLLTGMKFSFIEKTNQN
jgi:hypothetical protein